MRYKVKTVDTQFLSYMFRHSWGVIIMDGTYNVKILNAQQTRNAIVFAEIGLCLN